MLWKPIPLKDELKSEDYRIMDKSLILITFLI